jgi:hypothetical protein
LIAMLMLVGPHLRATAVVSMWPAWSGYLPGYPVMYPLYFYPGACFAYGACDGLLWDDRRQWRRPVAPSQPSPVEQDLWATSGSPWGYVRRLPPPTPASHIQPRYRDASTIRPEFADPDGTAPP